VKSPELTIGMAHFDDYDGVWSTLHALRLYHDLKDVQLLVVDNSPNSPHGQSVADLCAKIGAKYVPLPEAVGTSVPRNRVFAEAAGDVVVCMDCHVLIDAGGIDAVRKFYRARPGSKDMLCGPLLNDNGTLLGTQFNDMWRAEMWGVWGSAWECGCADQLDVQQQMEKPMRFSPMELPENGLYYVDLVRQTPVSFCPRCNQVLPVLGWASHEPALVRAGYTWLGADPRGRPFEVLGQGLGLFAMRRETWVGFHPQSRGFGGEELYVHEKVRRAGGRVMCHPALRWTHRFGRPNGVPYTIGRYPKVRNYVLEFQELDLPLDRIREHFVDTGLLSEREWKYLLVNPAEHATNPGGSNAGCSKPANSTSPKSPFPQPPPGAQNLDTLHAWCKSTPRDLDKHADKIRECAAQANHVTAIVKRREWDVFLLAGRPDDLVTYTTEHDALHDQLHQTVQRTEVSPRAPRRLKHYTVHAGADSLSIDQIEPTDLLVLDSVHHADRLLQELTKFAPQVRRRIMLRGTTFAEIAEGGVGPGMLAGLRRWMREHPEWSVIYHSVDQYGLTVISRDPEDKPKPPSVLKLAANFAKAVAEHVADGLQKVEPEQLEARLQVCSLCDQRRDSRCMVCGCFVEPKAGMRSSVCPLAKWPDLPPVVTRSEAA
jgi:hypothetical protein